MSLDPRADVVSGQYERWMYPEPIVDLPAWLTNRWQWFDPSHDQRMLWPDRDYQPDMQILIAGCGTNQAAVFAYTNPGATVVAIDVSQPSLDHHAFLKQRYGLRNLELHLLPIEEVGHLDRDFDLIVSTGVLHHLADPQVGMNALAQRLRPGGVMGLMLYARYGRIGVEILEGVFQEMGLQQDDASVAMVNEALATLPLNHPVQGYLATAPDLAYEAGLVDTFLHGRERSYTVDDCLELVSSAGMVFQDWFFKSPYEPIPTPGNAFLTAVAALPDAQRWSVMERIDTRNGCHFFTACSPERPMAAYRIDWETPRILDAVPMLRYRCELEGDALVRPGLRMALDPTQRAIVGRIDGQHTIRDIVHAALLAGDLVPDGAAEPEECASTVLRGLVARDLLMIGLPNIG
jgi:SAM-dependent methyltransferase